MVDSFISVFYMKGMRNFMDNRLENYFVLYMLICKDYNEEVFG